MGKLILRISFTLNYICTFVEIKCKVYLIQLLKPQEGVYIFYMIIKNYFLNFTFLHP